MSAISVLGMKAHRLPSDGFLGELKGGKGGGGVGGGELERSKGWGLLGGRFHPD